MYSTQNIIIWCIIIIIIIIIKPIHASVLYANKLLLYYYVFRNENSLSTKHYSYSPF